MRVMISEKERETKEKETQVVKEVYTKRYNYRSDKHTMIRVLRQTTVPARRKNGCEPEENVVKKHIQVRGQNQRLD